MTTLHDVRESLSVFRQACEVCGDPCDTEALVDICWPGMPRFYLCDKHRNYMRLAQQLVRTRRASASRSTTRDDEYVELVMLLRPERRSTPLPVFVRQVLKRLLRNGGWRCEDIRWGQLSGEESADAAEE